MRTSAAKHGREGRAPAAPPQHAAAARLAAIARLGAIVRVAAVEQGAAIARFAVAAVFMVAAFDAGPVHAQSKTGTTIAQFVAIEPSARLAAMGNAGVAVGGGIQSVYYNPGVLGEIGKTSVQFTHGFWFADIAYDYAAAATSIGNLGTVLLSVTTLSSGDIEVRTVEQPLGTGELFDVRDVALSGAWARQITDRFAAGLQVNWIEERIWHSSMHAFTASLGTRYRITEGGLALGSSLHHFGTKGKFDGRDLSIQFDRDPDRYGDNSSLPGSQFTDDFPVPILFRVGLSYTRPVNPSSTVVVAVDASHPSDNTEGVSFGGEWTWRDALSLRAGYQNLGQRDSEVGLTAGAGVRGPIGSRRFHLDWAWGAHSFLDETHRVTFVLEL